MKFAFPILLSLLLSACSAQQQGTHNGNHKYTNALINESSPYLLQHAHNPVDWQPWGDAAFEKAKKEGKLVLISVGYAACHWCHVMEHESFEDSVVAELMNREFVSIKVDREERPDVDDIYMNACHMISQRSCGWPLNAIALPDGRPIFAGTYFPKSQWMDILANVKKVHTTNPEKTEEIATQITQNIQSVEAIALNPNTASFTEKDLNDQFDVFAGYLDFEKGGRKGSPKFPMPANYLYLLQYYDLTGNEQAKAAVEVTLDNMAFGGIYDHVGGGFARYSVDDVWKVPHFEKMLYDNGQLVSLYSKAYQLTRKPLYKDVVYQTLGFIERELTAPKTGFYSSLDADSEGEEGKFYVWTKEEIDALLGEDAALFCDYYNVRAGGNWEHTNILLRKEEDTFFAKKYNLTEEQVRDIIAKGKKTLFKERTNRVRPGLDDKIITAWNGLMITGYADAFRAFGEPKFLETAVAHGEFILSNLMEKDNRLNRIYKYDKDGKGKASINGFLDDYALTIRAFVSLYQATFDEKWLNKADGLAAYAIDHFFDPTSGMFYFTSDKDDPLIARKMETSDNVIPGSNSSMARALFELGTFLYKDDYLIKSEQMLNNMKASIYENPAFYANWAALMVQYVKPPYEIAIVGDNAAQVRSKMDKHFMPSAFVVGGKDEGSLELLKYKLIPGQTTIYVCQNKVCKLPVTEVEEALKLME